MTGAPPGGRVAMIGLGRMGGPMADHVIGAGFDVAVFDLATEAMAARTAHGGRATRSPAEAADGAHVVAIVVFDGHQAADVINGPEGVLRTLRPGAVLCLHTTVAPEVVHDLAGLAEPHGVTLVDAGISGGETGARAGTLLTMVGGPAEALARARPVLAAFSKEVVHAGPRGTGMALKLARNGASFAMMAAVHEALVLAYHAGVDLDMLTHVLTSTGLFEQALVPAGLGPPVPVDPVAQPELRAIFEHTVAMAEKDLDEAADLARHLGVTLALFPTVRAMFPDVMHV